MKVLLLKDVRGVGHIREIKNVSDGYAVNFLFPHKLAEPATDEKIRQVEQKKQAELLALKQEEELLDKKVLSLKAKRVVIPAKATEKGGLFKTISSKEIARAILGEHALEIPESAIIISAPIKTVGEHPVLLSSKDHKAELIVSIISS